MSSSAKLKGIMLHYPTARRHFRLSNTMSAGKLKNMKFKFSLSQVKNIRLKNLRTVFQLCWDPAVLDGIMMQLGPVDDIFMMNA